MSTTLVPIDPTRPLIDQQQAAAIDATAQQAAAMGSNVVLAGQPIVESGTVGQAWWLGAGAQYPVVLALPRSRVVGAAGAVVGGTSKFSATAEVVGLDFATTGKVPCVSLSGTAMTVFVGCTFRNGGALGLVLVRCASGAEAVFVGCIFYGSGLSQVVDNPGATGNIRFVGCFNTTGAANGNVTVVG